MVGLLDIAPVAATVDVEGQPVSVYGVSVEGIAYLLQRFPQFAQLQDMIGGEQKDLAAVLFGLGPQVIASVIAAGCLQRKQRSYDENEELVGPPEPSYEDLFNPLFVKATNLNLQAQADLLDMVLQKTLTKGIVPFVARLESIMATLTPPPKLADKIKEAQAQLKKRPSASQSRPSLDGQAMQQPTSGA